jgi:hypothetical protein
LRFSFFAVCPFLFVWEAGGVQSEVGIPGAENADGFGEERQVFKEAPDPVRGIGIGIWD